MNDNSRRYANCGAGGVRRGRSPPAKANSLRAQTEKFAIIPVVEKIGNPVGDVQCTGSTQSLRHMQVVARGARARVFGRARAALCRRRQHHHAQWPYVRRLENRPLRHPPLQPLGEVGEDVDEKYIQCFWWRNRCNNFAKVNRVICLFMLCDYLKGGGAYVFVQTEI